MNLCLFELSKIKLHSIVFVPLLRFINTLSTRNELIYKYIYQVSYNVLFLYKQNKQTGPCSNQKP